MKTRLKISLVALFLWMLIIQSIQTQDSCPNGMRKTYLDETTATDEGSARNYVPALNFYEGNGALWYRRKVLIEPRFEVHLKAGIKAIDIIETSKEQNLEGFTIVISKNKNKLISTSNNYIGYNGFKKSYIIEFDFNKNLHDPDDSSYSFRYCDSECINDDDSAFISGKIVNQRYDPTKDMNWDFRLIYVDKKLYLYSGPNELIFTYNADIQSVLESNTAYIGFTGNMNGNRRELNVLGTFVCEDNFDISKMSGKFYVNDQELDTYTYKAGETVQYLFSFINTKGQVIPHCFKQGIWTYSFSLSLDCAASNLQIRMKDEYNLFLSMNACNVLGEHKIGISESSHGVGPEKTYTIVGGALSKIILVGHDGVLANLDSFSTVSNGIRTLNYGMADGDFPLKGGSIDIVLDFEVKDSFGNNADIGSTSNEMLSATGFSLTQMNSASLSMRILNDKYQLVITITNTGNYEIVKNSFMSESIKFNVIIGGVSTGDSYCTLEGVTEKPTLKQGETAYYNCYFKDGKGNIMDINTFNSLDEYDFSCQTKRTSPSSKTYTNTFTNEGNYYRCPFQISESGIYQFYGYLTPKGKTSKITITPKINLFYVSSTSFSLNNAKIFNYYTKKWISIENAVIEYRNDKNGKLTSLDLIDSSGILISKYKTYPSDFDASEIKIEFYSEHDRSATFGSFVAEKYFEKDIEYIGIFNSEKIKSDDFIKRSSFDYTIKITYKNEVKYVTFRFNKDNTLKLGSYTTCFHDLDISKTYLDMAWNFEFLVGIEQKIASFYLRTTDYNLYNKFINKNDIQVEFTSSVDFTKRVVELSIAGTYEVYVTLKSEYNGNIKLIIQGHELRSVYSHAAKPEACYLEFKVPEYFELSNEPEPREHYYEYKGGFADNNLEFFFYVLDKDHHNLTKSNYYDNHANIYSLQYGEDKRLFTISYNKTAKAYQFRDKLDFQNGIYTWCFFMQDNSCNHKYYVKYDQSRIKLQVSVTASYFNLLKNNLNINEYAYADVFLKDGNNAFMGITDGKLEELKKDIKVKARDRNTNKVYEFNFNQITSQYAIRFQLVCDIASTFEINVYYADKEISCGSSNILIVTAPQFSLQHSQLQIILDSIIDMYPNTKYTIKNTIQIPFYNLILYTSNGERTTFSSSSTFSCIMKGRNVTMELEVSKKTDYIQFNYCVTDREQFEALSIGDYTLTVTADGISQDYQLYLLSDGETDYSNLKDLDLQLTEVNPTHIDGNAGKTYTIKLEFKAPDGLRWNYWGALDSFSFTNSYKLSNDLFSTKVVQGYKKGQYLISVNQKTITDHGDNILTIYYDNIQIPQNVSLNIKGGEFSRLVLEGDPTDGNVLNHPILTFRPVDTYGNLYIFDSSVTKEYINSLTIGKSLDGVSLLTNNYLENNRLKVQYKTTISTNVQVTSEYFEDSINYRIKSGPISSETSYAEMKTTTGQAAGSNYTIIIYPKDIYSNDIDDLNEDHKKSFLTYYETVETKKKTNVSDCQLVEGYSSAIDIIIRKLVEKENVYDSIECISKISYIGNIAFHVDYEDDEIECRNCVFSVIASQFEFKNTRTFYKNKEYYLSTSNFNEVEGKKDPVFEISFYDQFSNSITNTEFVQKLNILVTFEGADIKLCVSNSGIKKIATLCPSTNGDDNINKWQYITNGDNYKLHVQEKGVSSNILTYNITIIGGSDGSSEDEDFSKTYFYPNEITIQAGNEGKTTMEIRTAENIRKNYWYPNIAEKIKVEFNEDNEFCSYQVDRADLPGQYNIKVTCTKTNENNFFTVTVDSNEIKQKIKLIIINGPAYYLEVEEADKFISSGDKYTWKTSISNDEDINFLFKLQDKYKNYIKTSVIGKNQILINSETFGNNEKYYGIEFKDSNQDYLFKDKINVAIRQHTWNIICVESNKKYSFSYIKIAGKVDINKSYWTIDKTEYILYESSNVLVTLLDKYGVNLGTIEGKLTEEKGKLSVIANKDKDIPYDYNSITDDNNIKFIYSYKAIGNYKVSVSYDGKQIDEKVDVSVSYQTIDLKNSQLYYDIGDGKENLMLTSVQTNINNLEVCPFYKLYLYTSKGERITLYDKTISSSCVMTLNGINSWDLDVANKDDYIYISHKNCDSEFKKLPQALYNLELTIEGELIKYPIYLMGEKDVSPYQNYDLTKTFVKPTYIDGVAGEQYEVEIEFRAQDGLRWNKEVNINSLTYSNSYNLDSNNLIIEKKKVEKDGQIKLIVTQRIATIGGNDNILYIYYEKKQISQYVTLHIKCSPGLKELVYVSGAVDGTVINPSIVKFIPKDKFGNLYTDLFDDKLYPKEELDKLTKGKSDRGFDITQNSYVSDGMYLNVQYACKKVTKIIITSDYNSETYEYYLWSGPIDPDKSFAQVEKTENVIAGDINKITIYPRDVYENIVTNVTSTDLEKFDVDYEINKDYKKDITETCDIDSDKFIEDFNCQTTITKSGEVEFLVEYDDKTVRCINCIFKIGPHNLDFTKIKVYNKNENKEMSQTELNNLPVAINPNFLLYFFDKYYNSIIDKKKVEELEISTEIIVTDVKLCVFNNNLTKLSTLCKSQNGDENEERWQYVPNGDGYKLIIKNIKTNEQLIYPVQLTGGYNDGGSAPVDPTKTYFDPSELNIIAGEEGTVFMELRTEEEKRKNYWYKEPEKHIKIKFPEDDRNCSYSLEAAEKPGQYNIKFKCYKKSDNFPVIVEIEKNVVPKSISIAVDPNVPYKSKLFRMNGEEIEESYLGSVSVEEIFQMINKLYDKYDNLITNINFNLALLQIKMAPINNTKTFTWSTELAPQANGEIIITLKSTFAIEHNVVGKYFPLELYTIIFTPGKANADNSLLEVSHTERWVGEEVKIYITPYDQFNNYIDPIIRYKDESPYQVKYSNDVEKNQVIKSKYNIELKGEINVLSYPSSFFIRGMTTINGYIDVDPIYCNSCRINIKAKDIYFLNYNAFRLDPTKNDFEVLKNGIVEKNQKDIPKYRLYPRDQYGNIIDIIPKDNLLNITAFLRNQIENTIYYLKLNNSEYFEQEFAEFTNDTNDKNEKDVTYNTLVGGFYDLIFTDGNNSLNYNISLEGNGEGGSNLPVDPQRTHIIEENLKYTAGKTGYMLIELRTSNNLRKNFWKGYNFTIKTCDQNDDTFSFTQETAGTMGVFFITVTTQKANTYPQLEKCVLEVYLNNELIVDLKPEMEVSPDVVVKTEILEKYYKNGSNNELLDGNTDTNYIFEVASYDKFDNLAETKQEEVGIKITLKGGEEINKTISETNQETGYRKYSVPVTKVGKYAVSTDNSGPQGLYLSHESTFNVYAGTIDLSKLIVKARFTPIKAGSKPAISIEAFDKYSNVLPYEKYLNNFIATFIDSKNGEHSSSSEYDSLIDKVVYTSDTPVTVTGNVKVTLIYEDSTKIDTSNVIIVVEPGDPDPSKSILSREVSKGTFTQYKNGDSFIVDIYESLILNITLYDKYNNFISSIPSETEVLEPILSGNYMTEIEFEVNKFNDYFGLDFNEKDEFIYIYQHLVKGTYDLTYKVKSVLGEASFKYNVIVSNGDNYHGNGPYIIENCVLTPKNASFVAGTYEQFTLELRTAQGLLYNDDIDIDNDTLIEIVNTDDSFIYEIFKTGLDNGIYTISIYSEKKGKNTMKVFVTDQKSDTKNKKDVGPADYNVYPEKVPHKNYTKIYYKGQLVKNLDTFNITTSPDSNIEISFSLADRFGNLFEDRKDIVDNNYLTLLNRDEPLPFISLSLLSNKKDYKMIIYPKYPPKTMELNILYNDEENTAYCFSHNIIVYINSVFDPLQTQIVSKNKERIYVGDLLDMWLYTFDNKGECFGDLDYKDDYEIKVTGPLNSKNQFTKTYKVKKTEDKKDLECNNEYQIITSEKDIYKFAGDYIIKVNGEGIKKTLIAQYNQLCLPLGYSLFFLEYDFDPNHISVIDTFSFKVTGTDLYGNKVSQPLYNNITIELRKNGVIYNISENETDKYEINSGELNYELNIHKIGQYQLHMYYNGEEIKTVNNGQSLPIFIMEAGPCYAEDNSNIDLTNINGIISPKPVYFDFQCYDIYNNIITKGGENFKVSGDINSNTGSLKISDLQVEDNDDGTYTVSFAPDEIGTYIIRIFNDDEKYGEDITFNFDRKTCSGSTPVLCPDNVCKENLYQCITPPNNCDKLTPFKCKVNGTEQCVKSQTDCDCPEGYYKCSYMHYCVPKNRTDMCARFLPANCNGYKGNYKSYADGVCRPIGGADPNQIVCPVGKVLCADLTCQDNYTLCKESGIVPPGRIRCVDQSTAKSANECPSTINCLDPNDVVCNNGQCVDNEIKCKPIKECPLSYPYLCSNNVCAKSFYDCSKGISCGVGRALCSDSICRDSCQ